MTRRRTDRAIEPMPIFNDYLMSIPLIFVMRAKGGTITTQEWYCFCATYFGVELNEDQMMRMRNARRHLMRLGHIYHGTSEGVWTLTMRGWLELPTHEELMHSPTIDRRQHWSTVQHNHAHSN